jgi:hypothetical protein
VSWIDSGFADGEVAIAAPDPRPPRTDHPAHTDARRARNRPSWYAGGTVIALLRFWFDIVLAFAVPRAALVADNLILRQQLIVIRRQIKR